MNTVDEKRRSIEQCLDQVDENVDWIEKNGPIIIDNLLSHYLEAFPFALPTVKVIADRAKVELAKAVNHTRAAVAFIRKELPYMWGPDALREAVVVKSSGAKVS